MALQSSGAISLDDIHVEAGGSTGTSCNLNDTDIRGLTAGSGQTINSTSDSEIDLGDFYGATSITYFNASGGTTSTSGNYRYHKFTSSGTFAVSSLASGGPSNTVDYLIIAGGGTGGVGSQYHAGGGGGAGGYKTGSVTISSTGNNTITVGAGDASNNVNTSQNIYGSNVYWYNITLTTSDRGSSSSALGVTSTGGGAGGGAHGDQGWNRGETFGNPVTGGSGGGGGGYTQVDNGAGSVGGSQGNSGGNGASYAGGGGGGKGGSGGNANSTTPGNGGSGSSTGNANVDSATRGGGGGGASINSSYAVGSGGSGGGGAGGRPDTSASSGSGNTGSGGGGACGTSSGTFGASGAGGSGIVILRYQYQG